MQQPKKSKYRKQMKMVRHLRGTESRGCAVEFGDYGLKALESGWVTNRQLEASRRAITRFVKRGGKLWIRVFCHKPVTKKPAEVRQGSGKGSPEYHVAEVRKGKILFEITGVNKELASEALMLAAAKLGIKSKMVSRSEFLI